MTEFFVIKFLRVDGAVRWARNTGALVDCSALSEATADIFPRHLAEGIMAEFGTMSGRGGCVERGGVLTAEGDGYILQMLPTERTLTGDIKSELADKGMLTPAREKFLDVVGRGLSGAATVGANE